MITQSIGGTSSFVNSLLYSSLWKVFRIMRPYADQLYFPEYFRMLDSINAVPCQYKRHNPKSVEQVQYQLLMILHVINFVRLVLIYLFPLHTRWQQILFCDLIKLVKAPDVFTIEIGALVLNTIQLQQLFYSRVTKEHCHQVIRQVLLHRDMCFLLGSRKPIIKWIDLNLQFYRGYMLVLDLFVLMFHSFNTFRLCQRLDLGSLSGLGLLLWMQFNSFCAYSVLYAFCYQSSHAVTYLFAGSVICFVRFSQVNRIVNQRLLSQRRRHSKLRMRQFCRDQSLSMRYLFSLSRVYGSMLVVYLLTNLPLNTSLSVASMLGKIESLYLPFYLAFLMAQLLVIVVLHVRATTFVHYVHGPIKSLISLNVSLQRCSTMYRFKFSHFIAALHTQNQYGITYSAFGLVNMDSFVKCLMLYSQVLMYNYRFFNPSLQRFYNTIMPNT